MITFLKDSIRKADESWRLKKGGGAYIVVFPVIVVVEAHVLIYVKFVQSEVDDVHLLGLEFLLFDVDSLQSKFCAKSSVPPIYYSTNYIS